MTGAMNSAARSAASSSCQSSRLIQISYASTVVASGYPLRERSSDQWQGGPVAADTAVAVAPEVLARYVGVYHGVYGGTKRVIEVTLSGDQLIAKVTGRAAVDGGEMRPLIPQTDTVFDGAGIVYQFIVDDKGVATGLDEIHISGPERFPKQP